MSDANKTAATTSMKGGGYYSQSTRGAKDVIDNAADMLLQAVASLPGEDTTGPVRIADFGAADGGTSKRTIAATVGAVRQRWPGRQIQVTYTDLASNDWSQLFKAMQGLDGSDNTYWSPGSGVFVQGVGIGFHHQLMPDNTLDLGFSATAMHYVSERPCLIPGHVHHVGATGDALAAFDKQAAVDWERILLGRAAELRGGGRLVIMSFGKDEADQYLGNTGGVNMFDTFHHHWKALADTRHHHGRGIRRRDLRAGLPNARGVHGTPARHRVPSVPGRAAPRLGPYRRHAVPVPGRIPDLRHHDPARIRTKLHPDAAILVRNRVRQCAGPGARPVSERAEIVDRFYQAYEDMVAADPDGHAMDYVHSYLANREGLRRSVAESILPVATLQDLVLGGWPVRVPVQFRTGTDGADTTVRAHRVHRGTFAPLRRRLVQRHLLRALFHGPASNRLPRTIRASTPRRSRRNRMHPAARRSGPARNRSTRSSMCTFAQRLVPGPKCFATP